MPPAGEAGRRAPVKAEPSPFKFMAIAAARAAHDKKGEDIKLLNVRRVSGVTDFLLLVSVTSPAHLEAVELEITSVLKRSGIELRHREGARSPHWRVLDYGGLLVHLMEADARSFYGLDKLYHDAPRQRWLAAHRPLA